MSQQRTEMPPAAANGTSPTRPSAHLRKLILANTQALGDVLMMTAAVRDLHRTFPGVFATDVRTSVPDLWRHNPYLTPLDDYDPTAEVVQCSYPLIDRSQQAPHHFIEGFVDFLNRFLGLHVRVTEFRGDIHLSRSEKAAPSPIARLTGRDIPFWIIAAGGKADCTVKWWDTQRYQKVIDHFQGRIQFVQVGDARHYHPKLRGVIDLRGQTTVRQLIRLMHHAQGVFCGVTGLMHLAAAVPTRRGGPALRPCVVVAGGREPPHWESYPGHQFIHTIGALKCCAGGGCWKSRTVALGDGTVWDKPDVLCADVRGGLPRCMDLISAEDVVRRIESYFDGGALAPLSPVQSLAAKRGVAETTLDPLANGPVTFFNARERAEGFIKTIPPFHEPRPLTPLGEGARAGKRAARSLRPRQQHSDGSRPEGSKQRGIVICAGGVRLFTNAWVCIHMLRRLGCTLPIELWHSGTTELDADMRALVAPLGVTCVDARRFLKAHPARLSHPYALKPYAILWSRFREVLLLDADNMPVTNPEFLFDSPEFRRNGAVFWPDYGKLAADNPIWKLCGVPYRDEPEFETGQILVNKARCWEALVLAWWYNDHGNFFYQWIYGDKDTFHLAFRKLRRPYAMPATPIHTLPVAMCQHDFQGRRLFQHRNFDKWNLFLRNQRSEGFLYEEECRAFIQQLRERWDGRMHRFGRVRPVNGAAQRGLTPAILSAQPRLHACMISCHEREAVRTETLQRLTQTDWGTRPVQVQIDPQRFPSKWDSQAHNIWLALQGALKTDAEFFLFLEDDLQFNRHLRHNLEAWSPMRRRKLTLASLCNRGGYALACDVKHNLTVAYPKSIEGSQAFVLSRSATQYILDHWKEERVPFDLRAPRLAARLGHPIYYHAPSLVQHVGHQSTFGGLDFKSAVDFDPEWKTGN